MKKGFDSYKLEVVSDINTPVSANIYRFQINNNIKEKNFTTIHRYHCLVLYVCEIILKIFTNITETNKSVQLPYSLVFNVFIFV